MRPGVTVCVKKWDAISFCLSLGPSSVMPFLLQGQGPHVRFMMAPTALAFSPLHRQWEGKKKKGQKSWLSSVACPICKILPESSCKELLLAPLCLATVIRVVEEPQETVGSRVLGKSSASPRDEGIW